MVDLALTEEQQLIRDSVRTFAAREVAPAVAAADRRDGHLTVGEFTDLLRRAAKVGLPGLLIPAEYGGAGRSALDNALVQEELGAVDAGYAASLNLLMAVPDLIRHGGTEEQRQRWLPQAAAGDLVLAGALNEPSVPGSDLFDPQPTPDGFIRTRAARDGDGWVLDGAKAAWVTNAGIADAYLVFARTDAAAPAVAGTTPFCVPADSPGLTVGPRSSLLGLRSGFHAEVVLDGVRVPADAQIGPPGQGLMLMQTTTGAMVVGLAAVFVGLARSAYEQALAYASQRHTWGRPIREHQAVALMLADMATDLRTVRLLVWDAAAALESPAPPPELAVRLPAAKERAVEVAIANAERAVKIFGGAGVTTGAGPEKLLRDAWTGYSCDFTGDMLRLAVAAAL